MKMTETENMMKELTLMDEDFFEEAMNDGKTLSSVLGLILNRDISIISVERNPEWYDNLRLGIIAEDDQGIYYNLIIRDIFDDMTFLEMQRHNSLIAVHTFTDGMDYGDIPFRYVICICRNRVEGAIGPVGRSGRYVETNDGNVRFDMMSEFVYLDTAFTEGNEAIHRFNRSLAQSDWRLIEDEVLKERVRFLKEGKADFNTDAESGL